MLYFYVIFSDLHIYEFKACSRWLKDSLQIPPQVLSTSVYMLVSESSMNSPQAYYHMLMLVGSTCHQCLCGQAHAFRVAELREVTASYTCRCTLR